jgi:hypothetical protein
MAPFELIVAASSASPKEPEGEDRVRTFGRGPGPSGVVVCDGVGSIPGSAEAAEETSELAMALLSERDLGRAIWNLDRGLERNLSADQEGATTIVVVCANEGGFVGHLMVGNGAVLEVVPMETKPGKVRLLWTSIALPQMGNQDGRPALRSVLPPDTGRVEAEKGFRKVPPGTPRLYLACSDGFLSEEERLEGPAPDGTVWRQVPSGAAHLLELLTSEWAELLAKEPEEASQALTRAIETAVEGPAGAAALDDDTTVGALLLRPVQGDEPQEQEQQ